MLPDPRPYFAEIIDPRRETKNKLHKLSDILMIVFCAVLSGIEDWVGMETFAEDKEVWFRGFLELPNGIPSHDTLSDVLGRLRPGAFADAARQESSSPQKRAVHVFSRSLRSENAGFNESRRVICVSMFQPLVGLEREERGRLGQPKA